ncbi:glycoside hydrolase family 9 protein [Kitasatospora sp. NPDC059571]|uniref:glycoside hydrolase family 9 protein n=1 Tax=Kitasatospora sp. NPDC059571 TaxID=3346871 RepID=UPI0036B037C8
MGASGDGQGPRAARCLDGARRARTAAKANPDVLAPATDSTGGGAYEDADVSDEFYWAAAELLATTGKSQYRDAVTSSPCTPGRRKGCAGRHRDARPDHPGHRARRGAARGRRERLRGLPASAADGYLSTTGGQRRAVPIAADACVWGRTARSPTTRW